ncbi:SET domain protein [Dictyocaulus viviparus]|uniref:SET domain protein n=1 Tax=Dictyocaulus viviparus TaxID=29172 RepID=A0A0D8XZ56_DICVI|nr:SET domain protein [Dictyocaulus viviparus]
MSSSFDPYDWASFYFGKMGRDEAARILSESSVAIGTFLLRDSSRPGDFSLSVRESDVENKVRHYLIEEKSCANGTKQVKIADHDFVDIPTLLNHFKIHILDKTSLTSPYRKGQIEQMSRFLNFFIHFCTHGSNICYHGHGFVVGLYRFEGERETDLPFEIGETLEIIGKPEAGWWQARNALNATGLIPAIYVRPIDEDGDRQLKGHSQSSLGSSLGDERISGFSTNSDSTEDRYEPPLPAIAKVISDRQPNAYDRTQLRLKKGQQLRITRKLTNGMYEGELDGRVGIVPFTYDNYSVDGLLLDKPSGAPILECHNECLCSNRAKSCRNRVAQHGVKAALEVYYCSDEKGFGVRAAKEIKRGAFVCEYAGEILNQDEVERRATRNHDHNYTLTVREHSAEGVITTFVDPRYRGNLARFINHGCEPNLSIAIIRIGYTVPYVGLFSSRVITAGEEICYDYGSSVFEGKNRKKCLCGFPSCRIFLPMSKTASEYRLNREPKDDEQEMSSRLLELQRYKTDGSFKKNKLRKPKQQKNECIVVAEAERQGIHKGRFETVQKFLKRVEWMTYTAIKDHEVLIKQGLVGRKEGDIANDFRLIDEKESKRETLNKNKIRKKIKTFKESQKYVKVKKGKLKIEKEDRRFKRKEVTQHNKGIVEGKETTQKTIKCASRNLLLHSILPQEKCTTKMMCPKNLQLKSIGFNRQEIVDTYRALKRRRKHPIHLIDHRQ